MKKLHFLPGFIFLGISLFLLTLPGSSVPSGWFFIHIPQFDKIVHIGMFGMLCLLFHYPAFQASLSNNQKLSWYWLISILGSLYGVAMEFVQRDLVANRSFEGADILADMVGSLGALAIALSLKRQEQA
jgi:VanZ family protein